MGKADPRALQGRGRPGSILDSCSFSQNPESSRSGGASGVMLLNLWFSVEIPATPGSQLISKSPVLVSGDVSCSSHSHLLGVLVPSSTEGSTSVLSHRNVPVAMRTPTDAVDKTPKSTAEPSPTLCLSPPLWLCLVPQPATWLPQSRISCRFCKSPDEEDRVSSQTPQRTSTYFSLGQTRSHHCVAGLSRGERQWRSWNRLRWTWLLPLS